ncbi:MAG: cytochrome d ubiquinol oxidase subunit [Pseudomonadota bacterium]|jgi:cytochrome d ubiquinol oxidase subunit II
MMPDDVLTLVWAGIVAFAVFTYVVLDGFDLGVGILFPLLNDHGERGTAMNSIAPMWDGNETWLVLGGGGLMAAFPLAYAVVMPAIYTPLIAMLLGLVFRGVAFEFRWRTTRGRAWWDFAFFSGSAVAILAQGIALGAILQGVTVTGRAYGGGWWDWLSPFTLLCGIALLFGYAALGACWLNMKTEDGLQKRARRIAAFAGLGLIAGIVAVSAATPFLAYAYYERWFAWPTVLATAQVPLLVVITTAAYFITLARGRETLPFLLALALFALSFLGLAVSMYPYIVPPSISIWDAAAPASSQGFMLVGALILLPIILAYTAYAYWVFRGKVGTDGYH